MVPRISLSTSGPDVSRLVYGLYRLLDGQSESDVHQTLAKIDACLENGITTLDHAEIYGGHRGHIALGKAIKDRPALRDQVQIITKCGICHINEERPDHWIKHYNSSAEYIIESTERALAELCVDAIDILLIHRPDPLMNADETARAFTELRQAGKIKHAGVSNFAVSQFELLQSRLDFPLVTNQIEISVMQLEAFANGTLDLCQQRRIHPMAWSPTRQGKLFTSEDEQATRVRKVLTRIANRMDATIDQVAIAWLLTHPAGIVPLIGSTKVERIHSAARAANMTLDRQDWFAVWEASTGRPVP